MVDNLLLMTSYVVTIASDSHQILSKCVLGICAQLLRTVDLDVNSSRKNFRKTLRGWGPPLLVRPRVNITSSDLVLLYSFAHLTHHVFFLFSSRSLSSTTANCLLPEVFYGLNRLQNLLVSKTCLHLAFRLFIFRICCCCCCCCCFLVKISWHES